MDRLKSCIADLKKLATRQASTKRSGVPQPHKQRGDDNQTYDHHQYDQSITGTYKQTRSTSTYNPSIQASKQRGSKATLNSHHDKADRRSHPNGQKTNGALKKYMHEIENTTTHVMGRVSG